MDTGAGGPNVKIGQGKKKSRLVEGMCLDAHSSFYIRPIF